MVHIDTDFNIRFGRPLEMEDPSKIDTIQDIFTGVSGVKYMSISHPTLAVLYLYSVKIPKFHNLRSLQADFSCYMLKLLPVFLESCPNLTDLTVDIEAFPLLPEQLDLRDVPRCLRSTLKRVFINKLIMKEYTGIKLVNYFLENSAVLKELTVSFVDSPLTNHKREIFKNLLTPTKLSRRCQVYIY
ncbi:unnamed protein product [Microthlaspi erraticum]|uniref:FBD domain-containing protein n=1 Tax=Microthlaspi erraticum TaxID=1685480 RepID=A0A6D2HG51_9BRAS|nr:unnamed protein product [Microthlaspi erraticum]